MLRVFARLLGLQGAVVEDVDLGGDGIVVVHVRPRAKEASQNKIKVLVRGCRTPRVWVMPKPRSPSATG